MAGGQQGSEGKGEQEVPSSLRLRVELGYYCQRMRLVLDGINKTCMNTSDVWPPVFEVNGIVLPATHNKSDRDNFVKRDIARVWLYKL